MFGAIIVAAGAGMRMGGGIPKQFQNLNGKPVLIHTIEKFVCSDPLFQCIVVVIPPGSKDYCREILLASQLPPERVLLVEGGQERQHSVYKGLKQLSDEVEVVCIHDGVRPLVSVELVGKVAHEAGQKGAVIPAVPVKDTLKEVGKRDGHSEVVTGTLSRDRYRLIQTPQGFNRQIILKAYQKAREESSSATDDAALVENLGVEVQVIPGEAVNIKLTTPEDVHWAEFMLKYRE